VKRRERDGKEQNRGQVRGGNGQREKEDGNEMWGREENGREKRDREGTMKGHNSKVAK